MLGILGKAIYDSYKSGRVEKKAVYMLSSEFEKICSSRRKDCCIPVLKKDVAQIDTRVTETEKQLGYGRADFKTIIDDISKIKQSLAGMPNQMEFDALREGVSLMSQSLSGIESVIKYVLDDKKRNE